MGWAYFAPYAPGSSPPRRPCVGADEWLVHEAGWHLKDGGMQLTTGAVEEPPRPAGTDIHLWHTRVWDLHVWRGFLEMVKGRLRPVRDERRSTRPCRLSVRRRQRPQGRGA